MNNNNNRAKKMFIRLSSFSAYLRNQVKEKKTIYAKIILV